jgi:hypothetical protein
MVARGVRAIQDYVVTKFVSITEDLVISEGGKKLCVQEIH